MFVFLLLATRAAADWVEIAQNHYRKEPARRVTFSYQTTEANRIYPNYTTARTSLRGEAQRVPIVGDVKRVLLPNKARHNLAMISTGSDELNGNRGYEGLGPVRTPNIKLNNYFETSHVKKTSHVNDETSEHFGKHEYSKITHSIPSRDFNSDVKKTYLKTPNASKEITESTENKEFQELKVSDVREHKIIGSDHKTFESKSNTKRVQSGPHSDHVKGLQVVKGSEVESIMFSEKSGDKVKAAHGDNNSNNKSSVMNQFGKEPNRSYFNKDVNNQMERENAPKYETETKNKGDKEKPDQHTENEDVIVIKNPNSNKVEVIWKLMKVVTDNISRNTRRSFRSKVRYLEGLRNNLLANIAQRIEQAWPDEARTRTRREARGHVEFPSSEGALMTISFLTFAVFLIKLVLQVIHTYKNKTMMVTPALVAAVGRAAAKLRAEDASTT